MALTDGSRRQYQQAPYVIAASPMTIWCTSGTTTATGSITFTLPTFTTLYGMTATVVRNSGDPTQAAFAMIRSFSTTQVVVQVFESKTTGILLGGSAEGLELATSACTVLLTVFGT